MEFTDLFVSFLTLSLLEIVLGIDNLIFISLVADGVPEAQRKKVRTLGLALALGIRIAMLMMLSWIMQLTEPLFMAGNIGFSFRDLLLLGGGLFLLWKTTTEMHADIGGEHEKRAMVGKCSYWGAIGQIGVIDLVFSFDSIITAVGIANNFYIMVAAIIVSMVVMLVASSGISKFLREYPTFKMLALAFILMIGVVLVAEGMHFHIPKAYIYFAFVFAIGVEFLNTLASRRRMRNR
jgi:predicted tellurium resistance membrane protein TerC